MNQLVELEEVEFGQISDEQLECFTAHNGIMTQWTCGNLTICGCD